MWRLELICVYIMLKNGKDPNTFAKAVPEDFAGKDFPARDVEKLSIDLRITPLHSSS